MNNFFFLISTLFTFITGLRVPGKVVGMLCGGDYQGPLVWRQSKNKVFIPRTVFQRTVQHKTTFTYFR